MMETEEMMEVEGMEEEAAASMQVNTPLEVSIMDFFVFLGIFTFIW